MRRIRLRFDVLDDRCVLSSFGLAPVNFPDDSMGDPPLGTTASQLEAPPGCLDPGIDQFTMEQPGEGSLPARPPALPGSGIEQNALIKVFGGSGTASSIPKL